MLYNIAGVRVDMDLKYPRLIKQSETYIDSSGLGANVRIRIDNKSFEALQKAAPHLTPDECEYIWIGAEFYACMPEFGGFLLHSSAVVYNDEAFLFSAPCGTGKSTHAQLWLKHFKGSYILNDDKPVIKWTDKGFYVYGTPFSGKTDLNVNKGVLLKGICMLERSEENSVELMGAEEALFHILNQTARPDTTERMDKLLLLLDKLIKNIRIYRLKCNMKIDAAEVSYNAMKGSEEK